MLPYEQSALMQGLLLITGATAHLCGSAAAKSQLRRGSLANKLRVCRSSDILMYF